MECIESCRNFKVDVHSIVGVIKAIAFLTYYGTQILIRKALTERPVSQVVITRVHTRCSN